MALGCPPGPPGGCTCAETSCAAGQQGTIDAQIAATGLERFNDEL